MNWLEYVYTRERRNFGRQCLFTDRNELLFDIPSNYSLIQEYILKNPVHRGTQLNTTMGLSECNTENASFVHRGMQHVEGGWPKDINFLDEEQTLRYRKKIEREEAWGRQVLALTKPTMHAVLQNNAVNIYQDYFEDMHDVKLVDDYKAHEVNIFRDKVENFRVIRNISWHSNNSSWLLATYGSLSHYPPEKAPRQSYIWDIHNSNAPLSLLKPPSMATIIEWCPKDLTLIAAGLSSGIVAIWDSRAGEKPTAVSPLETTHREAVTALCFVHSKSNTEFYTGSSGGGIHYWDARNLNEPILTILLDPEKTDDQEWGRVHGCSVLEFEYTIPIRYMAGTNHGYIFLGNRKGLTPSETWVGNFRVMSGPVRSIERNPIFLKNFLVAGDWCTKIWTEECKDNPLIRTMNHTSDVNCATWSKGRCSLYISGQQDGSVDFWDLIMDQHKPIYSMHLFKAPITAIRSGNLGNFVAVGTENGNIHLLQMDDALTHNMPKERSYMGAMFERDTRRVKLLEARIREIKLKISQDEAKKKKDIQEEEEEMEEEETEDQDKQVAPPPKPMPIVTSELISDMEEGEEEEDDIELMAVRNKFFELITDEEEKRKDKKYTMLTRTAFDPNFIPSDIDAQKYKTSFTPKLEDNETKRMIEVKAMIEERKASKLFPRASEDENTRRKDDDDYEAELVLKEEMDTEMEAEDKEKDRGMETDEKDKKEETEDK